MAEPGLLTLGRWVRDWGRISPQRVAIEFLGRQVTYAELDAGSERRAAALLAAGLRRGDRVATVTGNSPAHVELLFACAKAGLLLVPLNWRLTPSDLAYQLADAAPALVLVSAEHQQLGRAAMEKTRISPAVEVLVEVGGKAKPMRPVDAEVADEDGLLLIYTSGTTGRPKGAVLTDANCL